MADVQLSEQDIDYIARVVATEVPSSIRRNPLEYQRMVGAVVDTVTNRVASGRYGATVADVLNQNRAFSKIAGPKRLDPYGSVENAPKAPAFVQNTVNDYLAGRSRGKKSEIKGGTDYANPNYSDKANLRGWINPMIRSGAVKFGLGDAVHYHGNAPGAKPAPKYDVKVPAGFMPSLGSEMRYQSGFPIPPTRPPMALMAQAKQSERASPQPIQARAFAQGGILGPSAVSFNPVGSANAGEMPRNRPAIAPPGMRDRPMPSGPLPVQKKAATVDPATLAANYGYYGQTRSAAPVLPVDGPSLASVPRIQATGTAGTMTTPQIAGPLANNGITPTTFPPAPPKPTLQQKAKGALQNMLSPENLKKVGGSAIGSALGGPIGGVIGGLLAGQMGNKGGQGILGNLAKSIGPSNYNNPLQSTYIGNGVNAVSNAMWGNRRGDTATYNSQGGGSVTNLGGGQYQRTSNKYGFKEIVNADGSRSTVSTKKK